MKLIRITSAFLSLVGLCCHLAIVENASRKHAEAVSRSPSQFRSAFLLRERQGTASGPMTRAERRMALQRHFDRVIEALDDNAEISLVKALVRLEEVRREAWSPRKRAEQWRRLARSRRLQIERLRAYRDRGLFPQNEGHAPHAVPIFVDEHGTACAVGHLMRLSGWQGEVAEIAAADNLVYVPDVTSGPLVDWILTSGLTQEEAALIQPGYEPPPGQIQLGDLLEEGTSLERAGLRFENFRYSSRSFTTTPPHPLVCEALGGEHCLPDLTEVSGDPIDLSDVVISAHIGEYYSPYGHIPMDIEATNWIYFGNGEYSQPGSSLGIDPTEGFAQSVTLEFDVSASSPDQHIVSVYLNDNPWFGGSFLFEGGLDIKTTVSSEEEIVADLRIFEHSYGRHATNSATRGDALAVPPAQQLHIETEILVTDDATLNALAFEFDLSPSPLYFTGDFNHDGMVDRADVAIWQQAAGAMRDPLEPTFREWRGNTDGDHDIDGHDLLTMLRNFGRRSVPAAAAVPEPGALPLATLGILLLLGWKLRYVA